MARTLHRRSTVADVGTYPVAMAESRSRRRRLVVAAALCCGAALLLRRYRAPEPLEPRAAAQWPPLRPLVDGSAVTPALVETSDGEAVEVAGARDGGTGQDDAEGAPWTDPDDDGGCPVSHPVKAKSSSGIYHVPDGGLYQRTKADRCYGSPAAAEADGFRASKT